MKAKLWVGLLSAGASVALGCSRYPNEAAYTPSEVAGWIDWDDAASIGATEQEGAEPPRAAPAAEPNGPTGTVTVERIDVRVEQSLAQFCDVPLPSAFFASGSSELRERAPGMLDRVADCLNSGRLKARRIALVGYADPRGSAAYNEGLAASRAARVADYLVARGVARTRIDLAARGEEAASRSGEDHVFERRVDIQLLGD